MYSQVLSIERAWYNLGNRLELDLSDIEDFMLKQAQNMCHFGLLVGN